MWFLATELWPYLLAALVLGLGTGWLSGCGPNPVAAEGDGAEEGAS